MPQFLVSGLLAMHACHLEGRAEAQTVGQGPRGAGIADGHWRWVNPADPELGCGEPCIIGCGEVEWCRDDEVKREVKRPEPFLLLRTEVTQRLWDDVRRKAAELALPDLGVPANPSRWRGPDLPVENVSWCDAARFANLWTLVEAHQGATPGLEPVYVTQHGPALQGCGEGSFVEGNRSHRGFRLPTEEEWEIAVRAGTRTAFWPGEAEAGLQVVAWVQINSGRRTHPIAQRVANGFGLYDMHGNVTEWTASRWHVPEPAAGSGSWRVARGGSFVGPLYSARSAYRTKGKPANGGDSLGFRLIRP